MEFKLMDLTKYIDLIPLPQVKNKALDLALNLAIPFNRWLGMKIETLSPEKVIVKSPPRVLRRNHVGGAHACALALLGEYPAGVLISQNFSVKDYRIIISKLSVDYEKQGRGTLTAEALAPADWPKENDDHVIWIEMKTLIRNSKHELVADVQTRWQLKKWADVKKSRLE